MSTLTDQIDTTLAGYLPTIAAKQAAMLSSLGHYFQGLPSCSVVPADGSPAVVDLWDTAPAYQGVTWREAWGGDPPVMQSQLRIDQYVSDAGPGWVLTAFVEEAGALLKRSVNFGPCGWMGTSGWVPAVLAERGA